MDFHSVYFSWVMDLTLNNIESNKENITSFGILSLFNIFKIQKYLREKDTENNIMNIH